MEELRGTKLSRREFSIDNSSTGLTYNCWCYGDEASLYSIAEDSRDMVTTSEVSSYKGKVVSVPVQQQDDIGIKRRWFSPRDLGVRTVSAMDSELDDSKMCCSSRTRLVTSICLMCILIVAIVLSVTLTQTFGSKSDKFTDGIQGTTTLLPATTATPSLAPTVANTPIPPTTTAYEVAEQYVLNSIDKCSPMSALLNQSTIQGEVVGKLANELLERSNVTANASNFKLAGNIGRQYIQEKYALDVFFQATNGANWKFNFSWTSDNDPCDGWYGVINCQERVDGACAVLYLNLNSNQLSGSIPQEICCLPCLKSLFLAGNSLSGDLPSCLADESWDIDLTSNDYSDSELAAVGLA